MPTAQEIRNLIAAIEADLHKMPAQPPPPAPPVAIWQWAAPLIRNTCRFRAGEWYAGGPTSLRHHYGDEAAADVLGWLNDEAPRPLPALAVAEIDQVIDLLADGRLAWRVSGRRLAHDRRTWLDCYHLTADPRAPDYEAAAEAADALAVAALLWRQQTGEQVLQAPDTPRLLAWLEAIRSTVVLLESEL